MAIITLLDMIDSVASVNIIAVCIYSCPQYIGMETGRLIIGHLYSTPSFLGIRLFCGIFRLVSLASLLLQILERAAGDRNAANTPTTPASAEKAVIEAPRPDGQTDPSRHHDDSQPQPSNVSAEGSQAGPPSLVADSKDLRLPGAGAPVTSGRDSSTVGGHGVVVKVRGVAAAGTVDGSVAAENATIDADTTNSRHGNNNGTNGTNGANGNHSTANGTTNGSGGNPGSATDDKINDRPSEEWSDQFRDRRLMEDSFRRKALMRRLFLSPDDPDGDDCTECPEEQSGGKESGKRSCAGGGFGRENGKGAMANV